MATKTRSPKLSPEETAAKRQALREQAEGLLDQMLTEEGFATWLRLRRNVHSYSWANQVLLLFGALDQATAAARGAAGAPETPCDPAPTLVKAGSKWKKDGYHPAKGTRALRVWGPQSRLRKDGTWTCCGQTLTAKHSKCGQCGKEQVYFNLVPTFDASQVRSFESGERPDVNPPQGQPIEGDDLAFLLRPLAEWAVAEGLASSVDLAATPTRGEGGSFNTLTRELRVCEQSGNAALRTLIHELAHAAGVTSKKIDGAEDLGLSYADAEVAVECVSYIVAGTVGLDTSSESIPYMAGWGGEGAREKVRLLAKVIDETAKRLEGPILSLLNPPTTEDE